MRCAWHTTSFIVNEVVLQADNYEGDIVVAGLGDALKSEALFHDPLSDIPQGKTLKAKLSHSCNYLLLCIASMDPI